MWKASALAIISNLLTLACAVLLGGGGHGWFGAFVLFPVTLILTVGAFLTHALRDTVRLASRFTGVISLILFVALDITLFHGLIVDETADFQKALSRAPEILAAWLISLSLPQIYLGYACLLMLRESDPVAPE